MRGRDCSSSLHKSDVKAVWPSGYGVRLRIWRSRVRSPPQSSSFFKLAFGRGCARWLCELFFLHTFIKTSSIYLWCVRLFRRIVLQPLLPRFFFSAFFLHQKRKKKNKIGTHPFIQNNGKQTMSDNEGGADVDFNDDLFTCANVRLYIYIFIYIYTYHT